jgi:methyltransferase
VDSRFWFVILVAAVVAERIAELIISQRNANWAKRQGGVETGLGHYPAMVVLHSGLLAACLFEVLVGDRPFLPLLGWSMLVLVLGAQGLRWWCITVLGCRWNTRVIVIPGLALVAKGPYRWLRHPNYVAVVLEGIALPLVHTAWITAVGFSVLNAVLLLRFRIPAEERALDSASA